MKTTLLSVLLFFISQLAIAQIPPCSSSPAASNVAPASATLCNGANITLSLSTIYNLDGINYQWQSSTGSAAGPFTSITSATNAVTIVAAVNGTRWYRAVITCTNGGIPTNATSAAIDGVVCTGIQKTSFEKNIRIYPVPAQDVLTIELPETNKTPVAAVYSMEGRKLISGTSNFKEGKLMLDIRSLEKGIYLLEVSDEIQKATRLFVVE